MNNVISPDARKALDVGRKNHYRFRVVGQGDAPTQPTYKSGWWLQTVAEAPRMAQDRLLALNRANIPIKHIVIAHEAPKLLANPEPKKDFKITPILSGIGKVLGVLTLASAAAAATAIVAPILLLLSVVLVDPALIVILEDGTWIEVATWYE